MTEVSLPEGPSPSGGNFFTRKYGPLPVWGYLLAGVGLLVLVYWYKNRSKSVGTATVAAGNTATPDLGSVSLSEPLQGGGTLQFSGPAGPGDVGGLLTSLGGNGSVAGSGAAGSTQGSNATASHPTTPIPQLIGSSYYTPGTTTAGGASYSYISTPTQLNSIYASSPGSVYFQPEPGVFLPVSSLPKQFQSLAPSSPVYMKH